LRPHILDNMGLVPAIRWLGSRVNTDKGIDVQTVIDGTERKLVSEIEVLIFRIVQEALNNIQRHANASDASVILMFAPESLDITIQDNGAGFNLTKRWPSWLPITDWELPESSNASISCMAP